MSSSLASQALPRRAQPRPAPPKASQRTHPNSSVSWQLRSSLPPFQDQLQCKQVSTQGNLRTPSRSQPSRRMACPVTDPPANRTPNPKNVCGVFFGYKPRHPNSSNADHSGGRGWQGEPTKASLLPLGLSDLWPINSKIRTGQRIGLDVLTSAFPGTLPIPKPASQHPGNENSHFPGRLEDA